MGHGPNISAAEVGHVQTNPRQGYFLFIIMIMIPSCQYNSFFFLFKKKKKTLFDPNKIYLQLEQKKICNLVVISNNNILL